MRFLSAGDSIGAAGNGCSSANQPGHAAGVPLYSPKALDAREYSRLLPRSRSREAKDPFSPMQLSCRLPLAVVFAAAHLLPMSSVLRSAELPYRRVLPGVVHTQSEQGARFETSIWLVNLGASPASLEFGFLPAAGVPPPPVQSRLLAPGETLRLNSPLQHLFGLGEGDGALIVRGDQPFELRGVTAAAANPSSSAGQGLNSLASAELLAPGDSAHSIWLANRSDPSLGSRTDITAVLTSPRTAVTVSIYDPSGVLRGIEVVTSEEPSIWKASASRLLPDPEIPIGRVKFAVTAGEATAFLSVTGGKAGSEVFVGQPERIAAAAPDKEVDMLINGVTAATDLRLFNPNETELEITIEALALPGGPAAIRRTVAPAGLVEVTGVLRTEGFSFPEAAAGALRVRAPLPFLASGRGLPIAVPYETGFATPAKAVTLVGLNEDKNEPGVRSRIGLLAGANGASGLLRLRDTRGALVAATPFRLESSEWLGKALAGWFPETEIPPDARVDLELESGSTHSYAEVVDQSTQSRVVVMAAAVPRPVEAAPPVPPAATRLAFSALPASVASGAPFTAMIRAVRPDNSVDTRFSGSVELRVASGPAGLPVPAFRPALDGVVSFAGLSFTLPGRYTLTALSAGLESAVSEPFEVAAPPPPPAPTPTILRVGTFAGQNGYTAQGTLQIERDTDGRETLRLNPNFRVSSGAGTVTVWLARSSDRLDTARSVQVGNLTQVFAGEFRFPIPVPGSNGFTHVIVYCDAFRINFGAAQLRNP